MAEHETAENISARGGQIAGERNLPSGRILSYIAAVDSPTRVRQMAFLATMAIGVAFLLTTIALLGVIGASFSPWGLPPGASWGYVARAVVGGLMEYASWRPLIVVLAGGSLVPGVGFVLLAPALKRGRRGASLRVFMLPGAGNLADDCPRGGFCLPESLVARVS